MKILITALCGLALLNSNVAAQDWPQLRGPDRDAVSDETGLLQQWPEAGPTLAWKITGLGTGYSAPSIANGKMFGISNRAGEETVWALSEADGKEIWATSIGKALTEGMPQGREGSGCTPTVDGDRLYVIGLAGNLVCLDLNSGEIVWQKSLVDDLGGILPPWRYNESPLVVDDLVICTPGGREATLAALNKSTGETAWKCNTVEQTDTAENAGSNERPGRGRGRFGNRGPRSEAGYASPIAIEALGKKQIVQMTAKAVVGIDSGSGDLLWTYKSPANGMGINCSAPLFHDGLVFAASAYGSGGGAAKLQESPEGGIEADEVYFSTKMQNHHGGMVVVDGCLYGASGGNGGGFITCLDFKTGEVLWQDRDAPKGSLAYADGRLYLRSEKGEVLLIEPNRERFIPRGRFTQPDRTDSPAWSYPVIANGKLYIRDQDTLYCYDIKAK